MQKREDSSFPCNSSPTDAHKEVIRDLKSLKSHRMGFSCLFFIKITGHIEHHQITMPESGAVKEIKFSLIISHNLKNPDPIFVYVLIHIEKYTLNTTINEPIEYGFFIFKIFPIV